MTLLRRTATAFAVAASLAVAGPAFANPATQVEAPGLSPELFLASADTGERQGSLSSFSGLSHLEMKTSSSTAAAGEQKNPWLLWGVMFGSVFLANTMLAIDGYNEAEAIRTTSDAGKMPWLSAVLNFFLGGAGYIYNGQKIPLGVGLTLGALGLTYVETALLNEAQASGK